MLASIFAWLFGCFTCQATLTRPTTTYIGSSRVPLFFITHLQLLQNRHVYNHISIHSPERSVASEGYSPRTS